MLMQAESSVDVEDMEVEQQPGGGSMLEQADSPVDVEDVEVELPAAETSATAMGAAHPDREDEQLGVGPIVDLSIEQTSTEPLALEQATFAIEPKGEVADAEDPLPTSCRAQSPTSSQAAADSGSRSSSSFHSMGHEGEESAEPGELPANTTAAADGDSAAMAVNTSCAEGPEPEAAAGSDVYAEAEAFGSKQEEGHVSAQQVEYPVEGKKGEVGGENAEQGVKLADLPTAATAVAVAGDIVQERQCGMASPEQLQCSEQDEAVEFVTEAAAVEPSSAPDAPRSEANAGETVGSDLADAEPVTDANTLAESSTVAVKTESAAGGEDQAAAPMPVKSGPAAYAVQLGPEDSSFSVTGAEEEQSSPKAELLPGPTGEESAACGDETGALGVEAECMVDSQAAPQASTSVLVTTVEEGTPEQDLAKAVDASVHDSNVSGVMQDPTAAAGGVSQEEHASTDSGVSDGMVADAGATADEAGLVDRAVEPVEEVAGEGGLDADAIGVCTVVSGAMEGEEVDAATAEPTASSAAMSSLSVAAGSAAAVELGGEADMPVSAAPAEELASAAPAPAGQHSWGSEEGEDGSKGRHGMAGDSSTILDLADVAAAEPVGDNASTAAGADQEMDLAEEVGADGADAPVCGECSSPGFGEASGLTEEELGPVGGDDLLVSDEGEDLLLPLPSGSSASVAAADPAGDECSLQPAYCEEPEIPDEADAGASTSPGHCPEAGTGGGGGDVGGVHHHHRRQQPICLVRESLPLFSQVLRSSQMVKESSLDDEDLSLLGKDEAAGLEGVQEGIEEESAELETLPAGGAAAGASGRAGLALRGTSVAAGGGARLLHLGGAQRVPGGGHQSHFVSSLEPVVEAPSPDR
jgi:hypothetical protein